MDDHAASNMQYLGLNQQQYMIHCKIMKNMNLMPPGMKTYCQQQSLISGFCGDSLACWVADYIKAHPGEVAHLG